MYGGQQFAINNLKMSILVQLKVFLLIILQIIGGGAIANGGIIDSIKGVFINNKSYKCEST